MDGAASRLLSARGSWRAQSAGAGPLSRPPRQSSAPAWRKITNLLLHRHRDGLDLSALAAALCECLGQPGAKALCEELRGSIDDDDDA